MVSPVARHQMRERTARMQHKRLWFEVEAENRGLKQGFEQGFAQGFEQGLEQGLKQGFENGQRHMLYSLIQDGILSAATAAKKLGITENQLMKDMQAAADAHTVS